jgi:hypothetical protein
MKERTLVGYRFIFDTTRLKNQKRLYSPNPHSGKKLFLYFTAVRMDEKKSFEVTISMKLMMTDEIDH